MLRIALALFLIGQALTFAHASELDEDHHEHCGTLCVAMLSDEPDALLPVVGAITVPSPLLRKTFVSASADPHLTVAAATRPPATGPPLS